MCHQKYDSVTQNNKFTITQIHNLHYKNLKFSVLNYPEIHFILMTHYQFTQAFCFTSVFYDVTSRGSLDISSVQKKGHK
jgi:hypothetical protein